MIKMPKRVERKTNPAPCGTCGGSGEVSKTVRVGRRHRNVGEQAGLCLACMGTGIASK